MEGRGIYALLQQVLIPLEVFDNCLKLLELQVIDCQIACEGCVTGYVQSASLGASEVLSLLSLGISHSHP